MNFWLILEFWGRDPMTATWFPDLTAISKRVPDVTKITGPTTGSTKRRINFLDVSETNVQYSDLNSFLNRGCDGLNNGASLISINVGSAWNLPSIAIYMIGEKCPGLRFLCLSCLPNCDENFGGAVIHILLHCKRLEVLDLSENEFTFRHMWKIFSYLKHRPSLNELILRSVTVGQASELALETMEPCPWVVMFRENFKLSGITHLDISGLALTGGVLSTRIVLGLIAQNPSISDLRFDEMFDMYVKPPSVMNCIRLRMEPVVKDFDGGRKDSNLEFSFDDRKPFDTDEWPFEQYAKARRTTEFYVRRNMRPYSDGWTRWRPQRAPPAADNITNTSDANKLLDDGSNAAQESLGVLLATAAN